MTDFMWLMLLKNRVNVRFSDRHLFNKLHETHPQVNSFFLFFSNKNRLTQLHPN